MRLIRRLSTNRLAFAGGLTVAALVIVAVLAPLLAPWDPDETNLVDQFAPAFTAAHPMGADELGRDVLSRVIFGGRVSLLVAAAAVVIATLLGGTTGLLAGYFGGWADTVLMRINDVLFAIPALLMALSLVGLFGRSIEAVIVALGIAYTPIFARVCYGGVVGLREAGFVEASRALGCSPWTILRDDVLPNILPLLMVQMTVSFSWSLLAEAGLGFLGLGVKPPTASWGTMLSSAREYFYHSPTLPVFPGLAVLVAVFAFNLFGDGLRDLLDPRAWHTGQ